MKTIQIKFKILLFTLLVGIAFTSCSKDDGPGDPDPQGNNPTIILDCNSFHHDNTNAITALKNINDGVDYIINCVTSVGVDLKIEPGVVIEFTDAGGMNVNYRGSLNAVGTESDPIIFTGVSKTKGGWKGIISSSASIKNQFDYVTIDYAGKSGLSSLGDVGSFILFKDTYFRLNNVTITNSSSYGISSNWWNHDVEINNCTITGCEIPMYLESNLASHISGGNFSGNTTDVIRLLCDSDGRKMRTAHNWKDLGVPYRMASDLLLVGGAKLTIDPGVVIELEDTIGISIDWLFDDGSALIAVGKPSKPIIFTGVTKAPGAWKSIFYGRSTSGQNNLENVLIEYAGGAGAGGAIEMLLANPVVNVSNSTFKDIGGCAIFDSNYPNNPNPNLSEGNNTVINVSGGYICYSE